MQAGESLEVILRRWVLVTAVTLLALAITLAGTLSSTPRYKSTSSVYFSLHTGASGSDLFQGSNFAQQQVLSYAELVKTPTVLDPVIKKLGLNSTAEALASSVTGTTLPNTVIVNIEVSNASPQQAADIANAAALQLGLVVQQLSPQDASNRPTIDATTVRQASPASSPYSPNLLINLVAAGLGGLFLGILVALAPADSLRLGRRPGQGEQRTTAPVPATEPAKQ